MTDKEQILLNVWFNDITGVGVKVRRLLREAFEDIEAVYKADEKHLRAVLDNERLIHNILKSKRLKQYEEYLKRLEKNGINVIYPGHEGYPCELMNIYDPPDILYVKGIMWDKIHIYNNSKDGSDNRNIGIVGARNPDIYGREIAYKFAKELAANNVTVVSGLARGIDSQAHRGALDGGGYTIAVLGCGINVIYPQENVNLYHDIVNSGAVISEYGLDVAPNAGYFPLRNRIISGLSDGVLVVEAQKKSGSLITADCALEQGRQVYAIPGRLYDVKSEGTNNLIKQGAFCVTEPCDILEDIGMGVVNVMNEAVEEEVTKNLLAPMEKKVYSCLGLEPMYIDDIIQSCGIGITNAISTLYELEEKGMIKQPVRGYYIVAL